MRVKREFGTRNDIPRKMINIIFLVFEGEVSELIYFEGINKYRENLGIDKRIQLIPIFRSYTERGWTNPKKILDRLVIDMELIIKEGMPLDSFIKHLMDYLIYEKKIILNGIIKENYIRQSIISGLNLSEDLIIKDIKETLRKVVEIINKEITIELIPEKVYEYFHDSNITFYSEKDRICLIVDRDKHSFIERQYDYVLPKCCEKNIDFYVSNPCFEFWLLLHFEEVLNLDKKCLLENKKENDKLMQNRN